MGEKPLNTDHLSLYVNQTTMLHKSTLKRAKKSAKNRTPEERFQLLVESKILTKNGTYNSRFFTKETVEKSKPKE